MITDEGLELIDRILCVQRKAEERMRERCAMRIEDDTRHALLALIGMTLKHDDWLRLAAQIDALEGAVAAIRALPSEYEEEP